MNSHSCKSLLLCSLVVHMFCSLNGFGLGHFKNVQSARLDYNRTDSISWIRNLQLLHNGMKDCEKLSKDTTWNCFKNSFLRVFDALMSSRVIRLWDGIRFVSVADNDGKTNEKDNARSDNKMKNFAESLQRKDLAHLTWFDRLSMSVARTLTTHTLQINLPELTEAYIRSMDKEENPSNGNLTDPVGTARHRRHRYNMIITMMFGVTALGAVLVPMGFQILSVVSGKALLLAKMALLLASINGLKRVANSGVHYGLYQVPGDHYGGGGYYDRGDAHHPRNVHTVAMETQPLELGLRK